jgi:hypothetical protein
MHACMHHRPCPPLCPPAAVCELEAFHRKPLADVLEWPPGMPPLPASGQLDLRAVVEQVLLLGWRDMDLYFRKVSQLNPAKFAWLGDSCSLEGLLQAALALAVAQASGGSRPGYMVLQHEAAAADMWIRHLAGGRGGGAGVAACGVWYTTQHRLDACTVPGWHGWPG